MPTPLIIINSIITLLCCTIAYVICKGEGDGLIAGYNTLSEEEKQKLNVKRVRLNVVIALFFTIVFIWALFFIPKDVQVVIFTVAIYFIVMILLLIFGNRWAKKK